MRLPAEWEPQQLVLMTFPSRGADWGTELDRASRALLHAAKKINAVTPVLLVVPDPVHYANYAADFPGETIELPTNDCWIRDYGPITVFNGKEPIFLDFTFNGWGNKFEASLDNALTEKLCRQRFPDQKRQQINLVLEGGSIDSDGLGTILTTTSCLLSEQRNGWEEPEKAEEELRQYLGKKADLYWLTDGQLLGDDTDGHVDTLARLLDERTIAYVSCEHKRDPHYAGLRELYADLQYLRTPHNKGYKLLPLLLPPAIHAADEEGRRLPASYANFLISNGTLFLPTYFEGEAEDHPGKAADTAAIATLEDYGKYQVVPINCRPFITQGGSLHCLTMQIPGW